MMMPDCRKDDYYNEDFLTKDDKEFVRGFDWCLEMAVDNFFDNLDIYFGDDEHLMRVLNEKLPEHMQSEEEIEWTFGSKENTIRKIETYKELLRSKLIDYVESNRDELITSMIENMDEDVYEAVRNRVLKDHEKSPAADKKEYYDSRKFAVTGKKEYNGPEEDDKED